MEKKTIRVQKTARYFLLGEPGPQIRECWLVLHGYAQTASSFLKRFIPVQNADRLIVAPEGLHRFYREGSSGKTGASWMTSDDRLDDIGDYLVYLNQLIDSLRPALNDDCRFILLGFSQGGATAVRWAQNRPELFSKGILWGAAFPPDLQLEQINKGPEWWCFTGTDDPYFKGHSTINHRTKLDHWIPQIKHFRFEGGHDIPPQALLQMEEMLQN